MPAVEVIGVFPAPEALGSCHLVEVVVHASDGFDPAQFAQPNPTQPEDNRQIAYDERALNASRERRSRSRSSWQIVLI